MHWDIRDAKEYSSLIRWQGKDWDQRKAASVLAYWQLAVDDYTESDCDEKALEKRCGSLGEFFRGGDCLCEWITQQGKDAQLLWDAILTINYQLDGDDIGGKKISRKLDRATLLFRWMLNAESANHDAGKNKPGKFKPGNCPKCNSTKTKVASTKPRIRNLKCNACENTWKQMRYM